MNKFEWEVEFPAYCPIYESKSCTFNPVYRLVKNNTPTEDEFYPNNKTGGTKDLKNCRRWAVSFLNSYDEADEIRKKIPHFKKYQIAEGTILAGIGKSLKEEAHINTWRFENVLLHPHFKVI